MLEAELSFFSVQLLNEPHIHFVSFLDDFVDLNFLEISA